MISFRSYASWKRKDFRILIFGILISLLPALTECCWGRMAPKFGDMTLDYDLLLGKELVLNCTLKSHTVKIEQNLYYANSSHLVFHKSKRHLSEFVHTIDEFTAQLKIPVSTMEDAGSYLCQLKVPEVAEEHVVCGSRVSIGYPPQPVKNFECISMYYENFTCTWDPVPNGVHTTYTLKKYYQLWKYFEDIQKSLQSCPSHSMNASYCQWRTDTDPPFDPSEMEFTLFLIGNNSLGTSNQTFIIKHYEILIPSYPQSLRVIAITKQVLTLSWSLPKNIDTAIKKPTLFYQLLLQEMTEEPETKVIDVGASVLSYTIPDLIPHMKYNISLRCRSNATMDDNMWSPFTSVQRQMLSDVPYDSPITIPEAHEIHHYDKSRAITLYWKPVSSRLYNGEDFMYHIVCSAHNSGIPSVTTIVETKNVSTLSTKFNNLKDNTAYTFNLYSMNRLGMSKKFETLTVEAQANVPSLPEDITAISHDLGHYVISWQPTSSVTGPTDYVIFWCSSLKPWITRCDSSIQWINSSYGENNVTLDLFDNATNFQFAVASRTPLSNSGVKWATCIVPYKAALGKISYVVLEPKDSTSLKVIWRLDCAAQKAVVKKFEIMFCESDEKHQCRRAKKSVEVAESKSESYLLQGLEPFSNYSVVIRAYNLAGIPSEDSDPKVQATKQGAPADPPQDVQVISTSNSSVHVIWRSPKQPNGIITQYKVWYNNNRKVLDVTSFLETYETDLTALQQYTNYSVRVQACVANELCSSVSAPLTVETDVGVPGEMDPPRVEAVNSTLLKVSWIKPQLPNGPINFYKVQWREVSSRNSSFPETEYKITSEGTSMLIEMSCVSFEDGGIKYMFSVQAVNIRDDEVLLGPLSAPTQARACLLSLGVAMVIGAAIGGTLALAVVLILVYKLIMWMSDKIHQVKSITVRLPKGLDGPENNPLNNYENFKNGLVQVTLTNTKTGHLSYTIDEGESKNRHGSGSSQYSYSSTEELLYKNGKCTKFSRKPSGESSGCSSMSSNLTKSHASSESSTESDIMISSSPDVVFSDHGNYKNALSIVLEDKDSVLMDDVTKDSTETEDKTEVSLTDQNKGNLRLPIYGKSLPPCWINSLAFHGFNLSNSEPSVNNVKDSECIMMPYSKLGLTKSSGDIIGLTTVDMDLGYSRIAKLHHEDETKFPFRMPFNEHNTIIDNEYINGFVGQCQPLYGVEKKNGIFTIPTVLPVPTENNNNNEDITYIKFRKNTSPVALKSGYVPFSDVSNLYKTGDPVVPPAEDDSTRFDSSNSDFLPLEFGYQSLQAVCPHKYLEYNPDAVAVIFRNSMDPITPPSLDYQYNNGKNIGCELDVTSLAENLAFRSYRDSLSSGQNESLDMSSGNSDSMSVDLPSTIREELLTTNGILQNSAASKIYENSVDDLNTAAVEGLSIDNNDSEQITLNNRPYKDTKSPVLNGYVPLSTLSNLSFESPSTVPKLENKELSNLAMQVVSEIPDRIRRDPQLCSEVCYKPKLINRTGNQGASPYKIHPQLKDSSPHTLCNGRYTDDHRNEPDGRRQVLFHHSSLKGTEVCNV